MRKISMVFACALLIQSTLSVCSADDNNALRVAKMGHWLEYRGRPILPLGDSITQGWMQLGENFDQYAYVNSLAARGINTLFLWSYCGSLDLSLPSEKTLTCQACEPFGFAGLFSCTT
jgi:hypothetical protein